MPKKQDKLSIVVADTYENFPYKETISKKIYIKVIKLFFILMFKFCLEQGKIFRLPRSIGYIGMRKVRMANKMTLDLEHYRRTGEKQLKRLNMDGSGYYAILKWWNSKDICSIKKRRIFKLKVAKVSETAIRNYVKSNNIIHTYYYSI